ncbi:MAG TPA: serine/threonine-protein kinase [Polyangiaceae bacterium]|nr:serine/threonine-protein kinase [Polyangiaceae bacterium]
MEPGDEPTCLGPYVLEQRVAAGGMAEVYVARRRGPHGFEKTVALKRILPELAHDPEFVAMFVDEARVSARLCHPNVVQIFDFGDEGDELYMAMEYVEGTTVAKLMRAAAAQRAPLGVEIAVQITLSVLRALDYVHNARDELGVPLGLVHRDVSPGNLLISRGGEVKLTDFGIMRATELERRTNAGQVKGKLGYMSPEQVTGGELDARSDLFAAGIVLGELLTLTPLFGSGNEVRVLERIRDGDLTAFERSKAVIPDDLRRVVYRALAPAPADRFESAAAFAEALEELVRRRRLHLTPASLSRAARVLALFAPAPGAPDAPRAAPSRRQSTLPPPPLDDPFDAPASRYEIVTGDGPGEIVPFARLVERLVTGRLPRAARLARDGGPARELVAYRELARFVSSPALRWDEPTERHTTPLARRDLPGLFYRLSAARETGVLVGHRPGASKKIYFVDGVPEFVASTDAHELLGAHLVAQGSVLRVEVDRALDMLPRFGGRLGDALVGTGVLRPFELYRAVFEQVEARILEVFSWTTGALAFEHGVRSHEETVPLAFHVPDLVARGVRAYYTEEECRRHLGVVRGPVRIASASLLAGALEALRLTAAEEDSVRRVAQGAAVAALLERDPGAARALFLGLASGLLTADGWTPGEGPGR